MYRKAQQKNLFSLMFILFVETISFYIVSPVYFRLIVDGNYNLSSNHLSYGHRLILYAILLLLAPAILALNAIWVGNWSDQFTRKKSLLICFVLAVLGYTCSITGIIVSSLTMLFIGRVLVGFSLIAQVVARAAIADFTNGLQRAKYFAIFLFANVFAFLIGPHLGILLSHIVFIDWFDISTPFWICLVLSLFNLMLLLEFFKDVEVKQRQMLSLADMASYARTLFTQHSSSRFLLAILCFNLALAIYYINNFLFLRHVLHFNNKLLGIFASFIAFFLGVGLLLMLFLLKKYRLVVLFYLSLSVDLVGLLLATFPVFFLQWIAAATLGIATAVLFVTSLTLFSENLSEQRQGFGIGLLSSLTTMMYIVGAVMPALLTRISIYAPNIVAIVVFLVGMILLYPKTNFNSLLPPFRSASKRLLRNT